MCPAVRIFSSIFVMTFNYSDSLSWMNPMLFAWFGQNSLSKFSASSGGVTRISFSATMHTQ